MAAAPSHPPRRDTRREILEVASELFTERGYEATSLRVIAERLGITKAALYYHFRNKDDILRALFEPMEGVFAELVVRLEAASNLSEWADAMSWTIDTVLANVDFFRLLERNRNWVEQFRESMYGFESEHAQMHERIQAAVHAAASGIEEEIRMFAALGAITGFDDWAPTLLATAPPEVIRSELTTAARAILGQPER